MKIALCLSGQIRNWKKCSKSIKEKIIDRYNADVFIHTWTCKGKSVPHDFYLKNWEEDDENINFEVFNFYKPKKIKIDFQNLKYFKKYIPQNHRFYNTLMMWYSIREANKLSKEYELENKFEYDVIIRCRFDLYFEEFGIENYSKEILYLPPNENIDSKWTSEMKQMFDINGIRYMPNDQLAYGKRNIIDVYSIFYDELIRNINKYPLHPEGALSEYLWNNNINVKINDFIKMKIER